MNDRLSIPTEKSLDILRLSIACVYQVCSWVSHQVTPRELFSEGKITVWLKDFHRYWMKMMITILCGFSITDSENCTTEGDEDILGGFPTHSIHLEQRVEATNSHNKEAVGLSGSWLLWKVLLSHCYRCQRPKDELGLPWSCRVEFRALLSAAYHMLALLLSRKSHQFYCDL